MKRIAIAIAGSLIGVSAFAANYNMDQPKPVDFNNGELATFPPKVEAFEPQTAQAASSVIVVDAAEANNGNLVAYPLIPVSQSQETVANRTQRDEYAGNYSAQPQRY